VDPDRRRRRTRVGLAALVAVLVGLGGVAGFRAFRDADRTDLQRALTLTPSSAVRFAWTDWESVRESAAVGGETEGSGDALLDLLDRGFELDLTSTSAMGSSAEVLAADFGFSPLSVRWELLAQSEQGSALLLGMPEDLDVAGLEATWDALGFDRPEDAGGVWAGGDTLLAQIGAGRSISPQFAYLAVDADRRVLIASEQRAFAEVAVDALEAEQGGAAVADAAAEAGDAVTAVLLGGDVACRSLAMAQADEIDQAAADDLIAQAGPVNPLTGLAIAGQPGGDVRVAMSFATEEQARVNADTRAVLASGPAPGQGGDFSERFRLGEVAARGNVVTMTLEAVEGAYVLSDLSAGPVLFATC
jgi:hypothetical protein